MRGGRPRAVTPCLHLMSFFPRSGDLDGVRVHRLRVVPGRWEQLAYRGGLLGLARTPGGLALLPVFFAAGGCRSSGGLRATAHPAVTLTRRVRGREQSRSRYKSWKFLNTEGNLRRCDAS